MYADIGAFVVVLFLLFIVSLGRSSFVLNFAISALFLIKVFIGMCYIGHKISTAAMRRYFIIRYVFNFLFIIPTIVVICLKTKTSSESCVIAGGVIMAIEIILGISFRRFLKTDLLESFEAIPGTKIVFADKNRK